MRANDLVAWQRASLRGVPAGHARQQHHPTANAGANGFPRSAGGSSRSARTTDRSLALVVGRTSSAGVSGASRARSRLQRPGRDGVEGQALDQRVHPQPSVHLEHPYSSIPQRASSAHDPFDRRRPPLARHQQPFERLVQRRLGLQHAHHPRRHRSVLWPVRWRLQRHSRCATRSPPSAPAAPACRPARRPAPPDRSSPASRSPAAIPACAASSPAGAGPTPAPAAAGSRSPAPEVRPQVVPLQQPGLSRSGAGPPQRPALIESPASAERSASGSASGRAHVSRVTARR